MEPKQSQSPGEPAQPRPSTFSIAARDPATDAVGVAVHSKFVAVGAVVPWVAADAGAVATQSFANVAYGPDGLAMLREGASPEAVVEELTAGDEEAESRQVGVVAAPAGPATPGGTAEADGGRADGGASGSAVAAFTGEECFDVAGHRCGRDYAVQGNILENERTLDAMAEAFEETEGGLPERMLAALHAGNDAGGDSRGEQGAALYIAKPDGGYDGRNDRWIDVRVDDHDSPVDELERVFKLYDVTLLEREPPAETRELDGEAAEAVTATLADLGFYDGTPTADFGDAERDALEDFRGTNNFENHDLAAVEDALARGWVEAAGEGQERLVEAIWHGLSRLPRK